MDPPVFYKPPRPPIDIAEHLGLARMVAVQYGANKRAIEDSWQYAEALVALDRAAKDFRPKRGNQFSTLAVCYMRRQVVSGIKMVTRSRRSPENIASSLSDEIRNGDGYVTLGDTIPDPRFESEAETREELARLDGWLRRLDPRRRRLVEAYYLGGQTLQEISDREGVCRERVRQILDSALAMLRLAAGVPEPAVKHRRRAV